MSDDTPAARPRSLFEHSRLHLLAALSAFALITIGAWLYRPMPDICAIGGPTPYSCDTTHSHAWNFIHGNIAFALIAAGTVIIAGGIAFWSARLWHRTRSKRPGIGRTIHSAERARQ